MATDATHMRTYSIPMARNLINITVQLVIIIPSVYVPNVALKSVRDFV